MGGDFYSVFSSQMKLRAVRGFDCRWAAATCVCELASVRLDVFHLRVVRAVIL